MTEGFSRPGDTSGAGSYPADVPPAPSTLPASFPPPSGTSEPSSTTDTAKQAAADVKDQAKESAGQVAGTAKEQAKETASVAKDQAKQAVAEARYQARDLYQQGRNQVTQQASDQQQRLAGGLRSFSGELGSMAEGAQEQGMASDLARQAADYLGRAGDWLEAREPADLLEEVSRYARRHPGTFLLIAGGLGLLAGRVARGLKDASAEESGRQGSAARYDAAYATGYPTDYATGGRHQAGDEAAIEYVPAYGTPTVEPTTDLPTTRPLAGEGR